VSRPPEIASHPDRAAIEIGLANSIPLRTLGKRYGLTQSQLSRYRTDHMSGELVSRLRVRGSRSDEELSQIREVESKNLLDHFAYKRARLYAVADQAAKLGQAPDEIRAIAEAGKMSERIGKLLGDMGAHVTNNLQVNLVQSPQWHAIRTELVRALRPLGPDAIAAGARALEAAEATIARPIIEAEPARLQGPPHG
jgi:hypothetical protein